MRSAGPRASDPGLVAAFAHLHADAVARLTEWAAPSGPQERLRRGFLDHLAAHPDGVARAGPPAHLTASCLVLDGTASRVLLTHHRKADAWLQFGGHLEPGDPTVHAAAARETREESGMRDATPRPWILHLDRHDLGCAFGRCRTHLDVRYVAVADASTPYAVSPESHDVRWFAEDDVAEKAPSVLPLLAAACRLLRSRPDAVDGRIGGGVV